MALRLEPLPPLLKAMIEESAAPLKSIESTFAVVATMGGVAVFSLSYASYIALGVSLVVLVILFLASLGLEGAYERRFKVPADAALAQAKKSFLDAENERAGRLGRIVRVFATRAHWDRSRRTASLVLTFITPSPVEIILASDHVDPASSLRVPIRARIHVAGLDVYFSLTGNDGHLRIPADGVTKDMTFTVLDGQAPPLSLTAETRSVEKVEGVVLTQTHGDLFFVVEFLLV